MRGLSSRPASQMVLLGERVVAGGWALGEANVDGQLGISVGGWCAWGVHGAMGSGVGELLALGTAVYGCRVLYSVCPVKMRRLTARASGIGRGVVVTLAQTLGRNSPSQQRGVAHVWIFIYCC